MEIKAVANNLRGSHRKARIVADAVRGKNALYAIEALRYMQKGAAGKVMKVVESAVANAVNNNGMKPEELVITKITVDPAFTLKRMRAQSRGRGRSILKRNCHVTVYVGNKIESTKSKTKNVEANQATMDIVATSEESKKTRASKPKAAKPKSTKTDKKVTKTTKKK